MRSRRRPVQRGAGHGAARRPVAFAGALSADEHGDWMARSLAADGVSLDLVQRTERPTTRAFAELDERGEARYRFDVVGTSAPALDAQAPARRAPSDVVAVHVGTLGLVFEPIAATIETLVASLEPDVLADGRPELPSRRRSPIAAGYRARMARILARADIVKLEHGRRGLPGSRGPAPVVVVTDAGGPVRIRVGGRDPRGPGAGRRRRRHRRGRGHVRRRDARVAGRRRRSPGRPIADPGAVLGRGPFAVRASGWSSAAGPAPTRRPSAELGGW